MIKKVDILGIQLDNYTVREAIMCVERFLSNREHFLADADRFGDEPGIKRSYEFPESCSDRRERDHPGGRT